MFGLMRPVQFRVKSPALEELFHTLNNSIKSLVKRSSKQKKYWNEMKMKEDEKLNF